MSINSDVTDYWGEGYDFYYMCTDELLEIRDRLNNLIEKYNIWLEEFNSCDGSAYEVFDSANDIEELISEAQEHLEEIENILSDRNI